MRPNNASSRRTSRAAPRRPKLLSQMSEDEVVSVLTHSLPSSGTRKGHGVSLIKGIGDDCAVIQTYKNHCTLLKTDCVVENIHFLRSQPPTAIGWKAMCRAISDIAAMGGQPQHALITLATPGDVSIKYLKSLYSGFKRAASAYNAVIVGGETARSPGPIFINIALTGTASKNKVIYRSGGRKGDLLFVTGVLGGSQRHWHLHFKPRLAEAQWLIHYARPSAMMDLSDGLAKDLPRLARASNVGFQLNLAQLPIRRGCNTNEALNDGEDYELLLAIPESRTNNLYKRWKRAFPRTRLTQIGHLVPREESQMLRGGFDHFSQNTPV